jgi:adenylylsulfate kinase-like enzyme
MKKKLVKSKGILFWITGLSGTGKTSIGDSIFSHIKKKYGPTILIHGDDFRNIWGLKSLTRNGRLANCQKYVKFCKYITNQNINIIFTVIGMYDKIRNWNRNNIKNYVEIYIENKNYNSKTNSKNLLKNIVGVNIKAELPKKPDIKVFNNFDKNIKTITKNILKQIYKII